MDVEVRFEPHIAFCVSDRLAAVRLYRESLGMDLLETNDAEIRLGLGETTFYVQQCEHASCDLQDRVVSHTWLAFTVDDLDAVARALGDSGCQLTRLSEPTEEGWIVEDPYGLQFYLSERRETARNRSA